MLIFDVVRPVRLRIDAARPGLVAQRESVRLTRGRSLVRSQSGPQHKAAVQRVFFSPVGTATDRFAEIYRAKPSALIDLPVVEGIESRRHVVEFVVVQIGIGMGDYGDRRVAHRLLQETQIGSGAACQ